MFARIISRIALALCFVAPLAVAGCEKKVENPNLRPGEMPVGSEWQGVYYSPTYGNLHLVEDGDKIDGKWRTTGGEAWGELSGKATGNLLRYEWTEHKIGLVGPSSTSKGKGYFKYSKPENGDPDEIKGEWGLNDSETGNPWSAIKQRNVKPDPESVMPDEVEGHISGGDWDNESGKPASDEEEEGGGEEDMGE
ncbi:MAG: hypothetical protein JW940_19730 [Polyangiaceae bacterium]|nr:hypothetical protein [Polyangiaceae bacterium]